MRNKIILFLLIIVLTGSQAMAQRQDFRTWYSVELEGELFNLIDFSLTPEIRLRENSSMLDAVLGEVDISVPVTKFLRLGTEYRHEYEFRSDRNNNNDRFGIYGELDEKIRRFRIAYRGMYLYEYTNLNTRELGLVPETLQRHRVSVKYRKKKSDFTFGLAAEIFMIMKPEWMRYQDKIRYTAGVQYRLTKKINLGINYKFQKEYYENNPLTSHIISTGIEFEL